MGTSEPSPQALQMFWGALHSAALPGRRPQMFAQTAYEPVLTLRSVLLTQVSGGMMVSGSLTPFPGLVSQRRSWAIVGQRT